ncbi:MAG: PQQ-binding-like beta-propeller repeat protein [Pirellulales bacterium]|nr:PQQ-binding-like beta-propeller repeat protein [Pirellulales bacterium]
MKHSPLPVFLSLLFVAWTVPSTASDREWTRFRGPNGCGAGEAFGIPETWTERDYRWRVELPGKGFSSPVVWDDRLYLTSTIEETATFIVLCLNTTDGSLRWRKDFQAKPHPKFKANCDASASGAVDEDRLYIVWATPDEHVAVALDQRDGRDLWRRELGPFVAEDGFGVSPILAGEVVVLGNDQDPGGKSSIVALDRKTGETRWEVNRESKKATFSTPCLFEPEGGQPQVIVLSCAHGITSLDPATGAANWALDDVFELRTTGSPLVASGILFASNGAGTAGKYLVAVRPGIPERGIRPEVLYKISQAAPYVITPVAKWPLVFLWSDRGIVTCIDGPTGNVHWRERVGGEYLGSPVRVGDRIYCIANSGEMVVLAAAEQFKVLARVDLGEPSHSTPSLAGGAMYLRTLSHAMALGGKNAR